MNDNESLRVRHFAFIIDKYKAEDLEKLRQVKEQIEQGNSQNFKKLIYVEDGTKVYGYSISAKQLSFKRLRNMLSAKPGATEAELGDFQQDLHGKTSKHTRTHRRTHMHTHAHKITRTTTDTTTYTITRTQSHIRIQIHQARSTSKPTMTSVGMQKWRANTARKEVAAMSQGDATSLKKD